MDRSVERTGGRTAPWYRVHCLTIVVLGVSLLGVLPVHANCPPCGPDFCLNDARYPAKLRAKKQSLLAEGYPTDLVALLDRDGACVARVERAPDGFSIRTVTRDGRLDTRAWTAAAEAAAKAGVSRDELRAFYKFNANRRFACCNEVKYDQRPDWNSGLDLNTNLAVECKKSGADVSCR